MLRSHSSLCVPRSQTFANCNPSVADKGPCGSRKLTQGWRLFHTLGKCPEVCDAMLRGPGTQNARAHGPRRSARPEQAAAGPCNKSIQRSGTTCPSTWPPKGRTARATMPEHMAPEGAHGPSNPPGMRCSVVRKHPPRRGRIQQPPTPLSGRRSLQPHGCKGHATMTSERYLVERCVWDPRVSRQRFPDAGAIGHHSKSLQEK